TGGYTLFVDLEHASGPTGSDFQHNRALADATAFLGLGGELVLAGRLRAGWLGAREFQGLASATPGMAPRVAHPQKRFYAGGANSVRGYAQNQLGPQLVSTQIENLVFPVGEAESAACTPEEVADLSCDASELATSNRFFRRPAGGNRLLEGSVELRFPVWGSLVGGAAFVDFGRVHDGSSRFSLSDMAFTPGLGLRYSTPIGPLRVDVGYRPPETAALRVVTSQLRPFDPERDSEDARLRSGDSVLDWVALEDLALLQPRVTLQDGSESFWSRLQLHFSLGQAF
ncbi:MAG: BamA/TamA family outer membrane protein, partial [Gemmatimonadota bacterium]